MKYKTKIFIGIPIFIASIYILFKALKKKNNITNNKDSNVILMGGLDNRNGDLNINQQLDLLKSTLENKKSIAFRYNDILGVLDAIKKYPNDIVVLFSAGCSYSNKVSKAIANKNNLFIVEPYGTSNSVKNSVNEAINNGVPNKNIITGNTTERGLNIVKNSTPTPKNTTHWNALKFVGTLINNI